MESKNPKKRSNNIASKNSSKKNDNITYKNSSKKNDNITYKNSSRKNTNTISKKLVIVAICFFGLFLLLIIRIGFLQFVQGAELKEEMYSQLIKSALISPKRGTIYDSTGKALAISAQVDTVSVNPSSIVVKSGNTINEDKTKALREKLAKAFSEIFELDYEETLEKISSDSSIVTIAKKQEKDKIDKLKAWMDEEEFYSGINIDEDTKRYYPYENLASSLIGFYGEDQGREGLEAAWDSVLTGTSGKVISAQDALQELIPYNNQTYIPAKNGSDITLTIDANIQTIVEKYLKQACIENKCGRGGNVIAMDPKTGDILAMATYPDYDLNNPFDMPSNIDEKDWKKMSSEEKSNALYTTYRNRAISDPYEPGSVFKVITSSIALEESLASPDTANVYNCTGSYKVSGFTIKCTGNHGKQSLRQAIANSCNPAFIQVGQKIKASTFYRYFDAFGLFDQTGIAASGESTRSIFWDLDDVGTLELATMSFGQRFKITPLQMITAVSAVANDGVLMKPRIVKEVTNTDTGAITTIDPVSIRQVISKETASTVMDMLETVVTDGTGKYAKVKGYSIAGKTGTSEPDANNVDEGYTASFVGISPTENPEIILLITLYDPQGSKGYHGSNVAAPVASQILTEVLPYMQVPADSTGSSSTNTITLPDVTNKTVAEAKKILEKAGFTCSTSAKSTDVVTEQYPFKGSSLLKNSIIKLYTETENTRVSKQVPSLIGNSLSQVRTKLKELNLNYIVSGSGVVISQDPIVGTSVEEGTVIKITLGS